MPISLPRSGTRLAICALVFLPACESLTSPPSWQSRWILDSFEATMGVEDFLPPEVTLTQDRERFTLELPGIDASWSLRELCSFCAAVEGRMAPRLGVQGNFQGGSPLPDDVLAVDLESGVLRVEIDNGFNFDPIRASDGSTGSLILELRTGTSAGQLLAQLVFDGELDAIPSESVVLREVPLGPAVVEDEIRLEAWLDAPGGGFILVEADRVLGIELSITDLRIASIVVALDAHPLTLDPIDLPVGSLEPGWIDRVDAGALTLQVENDFAADLDLELEIAGPGMAPIRSPLMVETGATDHRIEFSAEELRSILGHSEVRVTTSGTARGHLGQATLRPGQRISIRSWVDLLIGVGDSR